LVDEIDMTKAGRKELENIFQKAEGTKGGLGV